MTLQASQPFLLFCVALAASSCVSTEWESTQAGRHTISLRSGVASLYKVDSTIGLVGANFGEPSQVEGDLKGRLGLGLAGESFLLDDVAMFYGLEYRSFQPELNDPLIEFTEASQTELFLGGRWYLPWSLGGSWEQLRPYFQTKLAYIPRVRFDLETTIPFSDPMIDDALLVAPFSAGPYWSLAAGTGLAYQVSSSFQVSLGIFYEVPLSKPKGTAQASLVESTGNAFVDNILDGLEYEVELEPHGWIGFLNLTFVF